MNKGEEFYLKFAYFHFERREYQESVQWLDKWLDKISNPLAKK